MSVYSEYGRLTSVAVCSPKFYETTAPINQRQVREYQRPESVSVAALQGEHAGALQVMRKYVRYVIDVPPVPGLPYMFNIRDACFVVGDVFMQARMGRAVRASEPEHVAAALAATVTGAHLNEGAIEGGDVIVAGRRVLVGVSERTNELGLESLKRYLEAATAEPMEVVPIPLASGVLHLDTALGLLESVAIVCSDMLAVSRTALSEILGRRTILEVSLAEADWFPTNLLSLDTRHVILAAGNDRIASVLRGLGWEVEEIPMSEHHRIGGSIRCMTLPLARDGGLEAS